MKNVCLALALILTAGTSRGAMITYSFGPSADVAWDGGPGGLSGSLTVVDPASGLTVEFLTGDHVEGSRTPWLFEAGGFLNILRNGSVVFSGTFGMETTIAQMSGDDYLVAGYDIQGTWTDGRTATDGRLDLFFDYDGDGSSFAVTTLKEGSSLRFPTEAVPEPAALLMMGLGVAATSLMVRRKK